MGFKVSLGILPCPDCGGALYYSGTEQIEIYDAKCLHCAKEWQVVKSPDGRKEIRKKMVS